jgi:hypothetical protein
VPARRESFQRVKKTFRLILSCHDVIIFGIAQIKANALEVVDNHDKKMV